MESTHLHQRTPAQDCHNTSDNPWLRRAVIGGALVAGAVILSPYVLPLFGVGETALAEEAMTAMHGTGLGNGLAGVINGVLNNVPFVGETLAQGGLITAAASAAIGIGGMLLGNYVDQKDDGSKSIRWGKVISTVALATSALIALPSLLTSISVGIVYMAAAFSGVELASSAVAALASTLGSVGSLSSSMTGLAGAAAALPHMLTCMAPAIPAVISLGVLSNDGSQYASYLMSSGEQPLPANTFSDGSITIHIEPQSAPQKDKPCHVRLTMTHTDSGAPLTPEELKVVHTEKIHLFVVDQSLRDYQHVHPQPTGEPGVYDFTFTPKTSYHYNAWADVVLNRDDVQHRIKTEMQGKVERGSDAFIVPSSQVVHDGIVCNWSANPPLQKGASSTVEIMLKDSLGNPVTDLEPIMGAYVHLVGFSPDGKTMLHTHPLEGDPVKPGAHGGPSFHFHMEPETSGAVQFYVQVQRGGVESYIPVGQMIRQPSLLAGNYLASQQQANHGTGAHL